MYIFEVALFSITMISILLKTKNNQIILKKNLKKSRFLENEINKMQQINLVNEIANETKCVLFF